MRLVIASRNRHKVDEFRALLGVPGLVLSGADEWPGAPLVHEDGNTFEENAAKKAVALARATGQWALADDSGLEVEALGGAPGVHSAVFAGEPRDDQANNRKLLDALRGVSNRRARFRAVLALASPSGRVETVEGVCEGRIAWEPRGSGGFGYDPLFVPEGYDKTFAEMTPAEKNALSHRGRAVARALDRWRHLFEGDYADWP